MSAIDYIFLGLSVTSIVIIITALALNFLGGVIANRANADRAELAHLRAYIAYCHREWEAGRVPYSLMAWEQEQK